MDITIEKLGPITSLAIPVPEGGGVVECLGRNRQGKSHAIEAVSALISGKGDICVKDGESRATVSGLGVTLSLSRRTTRLGELEVSSITSKLSIGDIIDPGYDTPLSADAHRIKAICAVSGAKADISKFRDLLPGMDFDKIVPEEVKGIADPVEMAAKVKAAIEKEARRLEQIKDSKAAEAASYSLMADKAKEKADYPEHDGKPVSIGDLEFDLNLLSHDLMKAMSHNETVAGMESARKDAEESLAKIAEHGNLDIASYDRNIQRTMDEIVEHTRKAAEIEAAITDLEQRIASLKVSHKNVVGSITLGRLELDQLSKDKQASIANLNQVAELQRTVGQTIPVPVSEEHIANLKEGKEKMTAAIRHASAHNFSLEQHDNNKSLQAVALAAAELALADSITLREAAARVDDVLSDVVSNLKVPLIVSQGRLYTPTERNPKEALADLSAGQLGKLAIDIGISAMPGDEPALITIPQEVWEGLDNIAKNEINDYAKERNVVVLTARHALGKLRAVVFERLPEND